MKTIPLTTAAIFATAIFASLAIAEDKPTAETKVPPVEPISKAVIPKPSPDEPVPALSTPAPTTNVAYIPYTPSSPRLWNVRIEVLMVAMPQEKAMALLPELRDPARCEAAFTKILAGIENKSILLMAYPMVETLDGIRAVSENITELRYPTEYQAPQIPKSLDWKIPTKEEKEAEVNAKNAIPTSFETRNIGSTLEVEPVVSEKGDRITLQFAPQRTELLGYDSFDTVKVLGKLVKVDQPRFATSKITTNITVRSGEHRLIAVHKLVKPENFIELFIAQAVATPVK